MGVIKYPANTQISEHFNSNEFKCPHCGVSKISKELVDKLEELMKKVHSNICIISSGYRCPYYDKEQNGFAGRHSEGLAVDCCFYDKDNKLIPSKVMCCVAYEMGFTGIAYIDYYYIHLDIRTNGTYYGDETRGNSSYWTDPYDYFHVSRSEVAKYTGESFVEDNKYQSHGLRRKWYPNVTFSDNDYAGVYGVAMDALYIDEYKYCARVDGRWLPEVIGRSDYAGIIGRPITDVAISGDVMYRVHNKNGGWLPWVSGRDYNLSDPIYGYAGNGNIIDAIEIKR